MKTGFLDKQMGKISSNTSDGLSIRRFRWPTKAVASKLIPFAILASALSSGAAYGSCRAQSQYFYYPLHST